MVKTDDEKYLTEHFYLKSDFFYMLEIACFEITSAEIALKSVADRIEFCAEQRLGGITPNFEEFRYLKSVYDKPVYVMIRPKEGDFLYSDAEFEVMKQSLTAFREAGADGFVFGMLAADYTVDVIRNKKLVELAEGRPCTFHRAIDRTADTAAAIQTLIALGFSNVLTSGGAATAVAGREQLKDWVASYSHKINILIGGGVRSENVGMLKQYTEGLHFHSSAILPYESFASETEIQKLKIGISS